MYNRRDSHGNQASLRPFVFPFQSLPYPAPRLRLIIIWRQSSASSHLFSGYILRYQPAAAFPQSPRHYSSGSVLMRAPGRWWTHTGTTSAPAAIAAWKHRFLNGAYRGRGCARDCLREHPDNGDIALLILIRHLGNGVMGLLRFLRSIRIFPKSSTTAEKRDQIRLRLPTVTVPGCTAFDMVIMS